MPGGEIEPDGDDGYGVVIDGDVFELAGIDVGDIGVVDHEILADVASENDCFDCIHDVSFLILFFLAVLLFGLIMQWGLVPELPELGDVLAANEWLIEELEAGDRLVEERAVDDVFDVFELDAWQYLASPPHVEDPISVEAILICDLSSVLISPVNTHWV